MKTLFHSLLFAAIISPLILAQTTQNFLESFDSGNAEGWAFYTDASVSVQNGQLNVVSTGTDFQIAHIYPPIGATINDFSIELTADTPSLADGGFIGRNGFNSLIGLLYDEDTVNIVYAVNITDYMNPPLFRWFIINLRPILKMRAFLLHLYFSKIIQIRSIPLPLFFMN